MVAYDLQARQAPCIAAITPILLVAATAIPGFAETKLTAGSIGLLVFVALQFVAMRLVRSAGLTRQQDLFRDWGGKPTTTMLRHRDTRLNPLNKIRFHDLLRRLGPGYPIPTADEETRDPDDADIKYDAAMNEIRIRAKSKGITAVQKENTNYGAARNLYALKSFGIFMCAISVGSLALLIATRDRFAPNPLEIVVFLAIATIASLWIFACTKEMVKRQAEAYASTLIENIELILSHPQKADGSVGLFISRP